MKLIRWLLLAAATAAAGAFVAELLRPHARSSATNGASGYVPPAPAVDRYVVLPKDR